MRDTPARARREDSFRCQVPIQQVGSPHLRAPPGRTTRRRTPATGSPCRKARRRLRPRFDLDIETPSLRPVRDRDTDHGLFRRGSAAPAGAVHRWPERLPGIRTRARVDGASRWPPFSSGNATAPGRGSQSPAGQVACQANPRDCSPEGCVTFPLSVFQHGTMGRAGPPGGCQTFRPGTGRFGQRTRLRRPPKPVRNRFLV
jgi:hypothetical protein